MILFARLFRAPMKHQNRYATGPGGAVINKGGPEQRQSPPTAVNPSASSSSARTVMANAATSSSNLDFAPPPPPSITSNGDGNFRWAPEGEGQRGAIRLNENLVAAVNRLLPLEHNWYPITDTYQQLSTDIKQDVRTLYKRLDAFFLDPSVRDQYDVDEMGIRVRRRRQKHQMETVSSAVPIPEAQNAMMATHFEISKQEISRTAKRRKRKRLEKKMGLAQVGQLSGVTTPPK